MSSNFADDRTGATNFTVNYDKALLGYSLREWSSYGGVRVEVKALLLSEG